MVAKWFDGVSKEIIEVKNRLGNVEENLKATRQDILNLGDRFVPRNEFYDLATRVGLLEQKRKVKR